MSGKKRSLCPSCGKQAAGNFCQHCGSALGGRFCNQCGAELPSEGRFCNQCGATAKDSPAKDATAKASKAGGKAASGKRRGGGASKETAAAGATANHLPWWFAGFSMFALIMVVGWNMVQPAGPTAPAGGGMTPGAAPTGAPGAASTDISQMSPREAADNLFNRVMQAASAGDSAQAQGFLPMALQAYEMAQPLDMDGLFHLALLQRTAGQPESALATAQQMLETEPNHILALGAAAEAAVELGETDQATAFYQQLLANIDTEIGRTLPEYQQHMNFFESARADAQAFLAGG